jgi:D-alanyl-D-alanine carboxypeptidase
MKHILFLLLAVAMAFTSCKKELLTGGPSSCTGSETGTTTHPMKDSLQAIVNRYIAKGLPGIQVAVKNNDGLYVTSGGYAHIETKTPFETCATSWIFSITKTYTAVLVLKQQEKGLIDVSKPIAQYLPKAVADHLVGSDEITVRMLLSHTSGIVDHTTLPEFMVRQFNDPAHQPSMQEDVEMVYGKPLLFEPGSDFSYCNTNYLLLQFILENSTGESYEHLLRSEILQPLHLKNTYYNVNAGLLKSLGFPNYYFDRHGNDQLENATQWNNYLGNASYAYGGIAATATDVISFYEALVKGQVISAASLQQMKIWVQGKASTQPDYGLGLEYFQFASGSTGQYGHEGDGIGNSTLVMYVPDNNTFLYVNITAGRKLAGPYLFKVTDFKNEISKYVATWR